MEEIDIIICVKKKTRTKRIKNYREASKSKKS